jgi:hypothetical protein
MADSAIDQCESKTTKEEYGEDSQKKIPVKEILKNATDQMDAELLETIRSKMKKFDSENRYYLIFRVDTVSHGLKQRHLQVVSLHYPDLLQVHGSPLTFIFLHLVTEHRTIALAALVKH